MRLAPSVDEPAEIVAPFHVPEPVGVMGIVCPETAPLLGFVSTVMPAIALGTERPEPGADARVLRGGFLEAKRYRDPE